MNFEGKQIAFGLDYALYAFRNTILELKTIVIEGGNVIPIMLEETFKCEEAAEFVKEIEEIAGKRIVINEEEAEKLEIDAVIIAPFCGNHIAKLASSIYDTPILAVIKTALRKNKPVLLRNTSKRRP